MKYLYLALIWSAWCFLHSALISLRVKRYLKERLQDRFRYFRIAYNGIALFTLIPVVLYAYALQTHPLFVWQGYLRVPQFFLLCLSISLFVSGARRYDALAFLGVRQMKESNSCLGLTEDCTLDTSGVLGLVRHPWYAGGLVILWARGLDVSAIITNLILSGYLILGAFQEERKLSIEFPGAYREYQEKVSMFFPWKWLKSSLIHRLYR
ncbi:MAG: hypothetical protein ABII06_08820 [Pseudomonadota bacterium]